MVQHSRPCLQPLAMQVPWECTPEARACRVPVHQPDQRQVGEGGGQAAQEGPAGQRGGSRRRGYCTEWSLNSCSKFAAKCMPLPKAEARLVARSGTPLAVTSMQGAVSKKRC